MTYSTPALLVRAGQGVFFVSFSFWVHLAQLKHPLTSQEPWLILQVQNQRPPTFLFWPQAVPAHLSYFWPLAQTLQLSSHNWPQVPHLLTHLLPLLFSLTSLLCQVVPLMMKIFHVLQHLLCLCHEGSGDGRTDRTSQSHRRRGMARLQEGNWHKERISLKLCQKPFLPEPVPSPLTGTLVLVTPIELHGDFKHIITFYGGYFKVQLRMSPFNWESILNSYQKLCKLK